MEDFIVKKLLIVSIALFALLVPTLASACHVTNVDGNADCNGWSLCADVFFTSEVDAGRLEYSVVVRDVTGEIVTGIDELVHVYPEPGVAGEFTFCFEGIWEGEYIVSQPVVEITANLVNRPGTTFTFDLNCTVDEETTTFSSLKAQYR
jgi:hypothetical protein